MTLTRNSTLRAALPGVLAAALLLSACGGDSGTVAQTTDSAATDTDVSSDVAPAAERAPVTDGSTAAESATPPMTAAKVAAPSGNSGGDDAKAPVGKTDTSASAAEKRPAVAGGAQKRTSAEQSDTDQKIYEAKQGSTDIGVTRENIKLGSVNMHGMALGNLVTAPVVRGNIAAAAAINDRGGVLGRRLSITDCDDGPGEVSRAKACIKKLVAQDKVFSLITGVDWATASIHDDLRQYKLPYVGAWAYSQTEWQDPYMFPTHMSMVHEAMAGANWVKNVIKPKAYGLICLTSPEMQLSCAQVRKILDASGAKLVKKMDVSISETSMSSQVLAMRAANPDHIVHYVINPATVIKILVEAGQQGYYPPKGISGNHMAAEVLGSIFGKDPVGRYWTNTTYKLWGPEFISTMSKYARANNGRNHHIVQVGYTALNIFAAAAKAVGPNLTRERLMAELSNGAWSSDAFLDQRFGYTQAERGGSFEKQSWNSGHAQGREFMYKYTSTNTVSNPDGSPSGLTPDPDQFVISTN